MKNIRQEPMEEPKFGQNSFACSANRVRPGSGGRVLLLLGLWLVVALGTAPTSSAAIVGTNTPALPLTAARIASLPQSEQPPWREYLERSGRQRELDQSVLRKELRDHNLKKVILPPESGRFRLLPLTQSEDWYRGEAARHIADVVVSFQTPAGGWSKNLDMRGNPRVPGMHFAPNNESRFLETADFDAPLNANWNYVGTFDNGATLTQLRYLAKVVAALGPGEGDTYRASFLRGLDYIFAAQYPNGGWPQVWPLQGGYHDAITYNDDAMVNILRLLLGIAEATNEFSFVPAPTRELARARLERGIQCLLACQIAVNGRRTVWCQQHDMLTLQPTSARNYEMPSETAAESAGIVTFLMQLPHPQPAVVAAVYSAAAWFEKTGLHDVAFRRTGSSGRRLVPEPGNGPLWARYYEIGTDRPIFGDRDKTIHDSVDEISKERRDGYSWYTDSPARMLNAYARWRREHAAP